MSHRAPKPKKAQPRTALKTQNVQPASVTSNPSTISERAEITPINEAPAFIAGPGATTLQPPMSLAQLIADAKAHPAPAWPIPDLLPHGLCLLAAKPHAGSRTLALQLALSIACDTPALDHFTPTSGEVLYLAFHQTPDAIIAHTQALLATKTLPSQLSWSNTWQDWQQDGFTNLNNWLNEHPHTRLLVIDSFSDLLPPGTSIRHAYQMLRQLNHLAHTHHLCILLLHSLARVSTRDPFSSIPCSPLLLETCETLAVLEHDRGSEHATLHLTSHALPIRALPLSLHTDTNSWSLDTSSPHDALIPEQSASSLAAMPHSTYDLASDEHHIPETHIYESSVTPTSSTPLSGGRRLVPDTRNATRNTTQDLSN